jgi:SAM-dependent methyltransferase
MGINKESSRTSLQDKEKYLYWLDESHPNYERWRRSREISGERAKLIEVLIADEEKISGKLILDIGSGTGATAAYFSKKNSVVSTDINYLKMQEGILPVGVLSVCADANFLPMKKEIFDIIILQDVIEHIELSPVFMSEICSLLKPDGILYISTPNRTSVFNILSDPHWGFPFVALLSRTAIKRYFLPFFRKQEIHRSGIAQLLSLKDISRYSAGLISVQLRTVQALQALFAGHRGVVWSNFHLSIIKAVKVLRLNGILLHVANNKSGFLNRYVTPTFYCVCKKLR